jgi:hypothetical protein
MTSQELLFKLKLMQNLYFVIACETSFEEFIVSLSCDNETTDFLRET